MDFISKNNSHWNEYTVPKMKHFALVLVDQKERIISVSGEHWNPNGPKTKKELAETKRKLESVEGVCAKPVWCKTSHGNSFWEVNEEDIPDDATTELDKYLIISVDEYGNKEIDQNPVKDEFDLWDYFYEVSSKVARLECHWHAYDKNRIPEIYELKEGFIAQKLEEGWKSYDIVSEPVNYNALADKNMLDEIIANRAKIGEKHPEFITMDEAFQYFLKKFE